MEESAKQLVPDYSDACMRVFIPSLLSVSLEASYSYNFGKRSGLLRRPLNHRLHLKSPLYAKAQAAMRIIPNLLCKH